MAKKAIQEVNFCSDIDLADTFIGQSFDNEMNFSLTSTLPETQTDFSISDLKIKVMIHCQGHSLSRNNKMILKFQSFIKRLLVKMKLYKSLFVIMKRMGF
jgi:hypothetical protein